MFKTSGKGNKALALPFKLAALVVCGLCAQADAGEFTISPIRIYMNPEDRAVAITINNEGDQPLVMQADLYTWSQDLEGNEVLELSEDIFLSPPIIKLEPNGRQVVRLARLNNAAPTEQLTYRLIAREIPEAAAPTDGAQVQIALALSLPIFITPRNAKSELACTFDQASTSSHVVCENVGTAYAQPRAMVLSDAEGQTLAELQPASYILPGIKMSYDLPTDSIASGADKLQVTLDDNSQVMFDISPE
ncbi:MAG: fimbria/pilus periplasmic chaperone [Pseudomonadota bacterium]